MNKYIDHQQITFQSFLQCGNFFQTVRPTQKPVWTGENLLQSQKCELHVFCVSQDMAAVSWKVICIPYSICKSLNVVGLMSQAMMSSLFPNYVSGETPGRAVLFFVFTVDNCLCQWARGILIQTPLTLRTFPSQTGRYHLLSQLTEFKRLDLLWFWWVSCGHNLIHHKGIKLIIWQNPSKIHLHISFEWVTGLLRIYPNTALQVKWQTCKVPWKQSL